LRNGNAFLAFVDDSLQFLQDRTVFSYFSEPLPSVTDDSLGKMIARFMRLEKRERRLFLDALEGEQRSLFGIYGHRAATLSVRQRSRELLLWGLVGTAIANVVIPERRRIEVSLAVFHHCARELNLNTANLFDEASNYATPEYAERLAAFGRRSDVNLAKFGWRIVKTPDGVKFTWG
jgi:hypothetical protein